MSFKVGQSPAKQDREYKLVNKCKKSAEHQGKVDQFVKELLSFWGDGRVS
jgi:hypothetical protein